MYVKLIGQDSVDVAKTLNLISILYAKQCNYVLSTRLLKESLRIRELILGKENVEVASTLFALGVVHDKIADYTQALEFYSTALKISQSQLGDKCIEAAETLANIGIVYGNMGQFDNGIKQWEKSLLIFKQCGIGSEDPAVIVVQENMNVAKELAAANVHQGL
jgi:tetratricopeptide (TPR) repeat protein